MKIFSKLFLVFALVAISTVSKSQNFTAIEFINLTYKSQDALKSALETKGYTFSSTEKSDLSQNDVYTGQNNTNVSVIIPNFQDGQNLISWEFVGMENVYSNLKRELATDGFKVLEQEVRNGSRYAVTTYQKPGITITLSKDKTEDSRGIYRLSARYSNPGMYQSNTDTHQRVQ